MISEGESSCVLLRLVQASSLIRRHQVLNSTLQLTSNIRLATFADNVSSSFPDPETAAFPSYSELWLQSRRNATIRGFNVKQVFVRRSRFSVYQVGGRHGSEFRNEDGNSRPMICSVQLSSVIESSHRDRLLSLRHRSRAPSSLAFALAAR
jgi:hypothetical protein